MTINYFDFSGTTIVLSSGYEDTRIGKNELSEWGEELLCDYEPWCAINSNKPHEIVHIKLDGEEDDLYNDLDNLMTELIRLVPVIADEMRHVHQNYVIFHGVDASLDLARSFEEKMKKSHYCRIYGIDRIGKVNNILFVFMDAEAG